MRLFKRRALVTLQSTEAGIRIADLRMSFTAERSTAKEPNTLQLGIYNLSPEHRAAFQVKGTKVLLEAGYETQGGPAQLFSGEARQVYSVRQGPDWITRINCGDGETAFRGAHFSGAFKPGTKAKDVALQLARASGLGEGNLAEQLRAHGGALVEFTQGTSVHGPALPELARVLRSLGFEWSIQDGELQVLRPGEPRRNEAVVLSASTGLVGSPEHGSPEKDGKAPLLKVRCLLNPTIRPGTKVQVRSESINGNYRVEKLRHQGDTNGGDWYSDLEAAPL